MGLPSSVSFRSSQIDPTSMIPAAPRQMEPSEDSRRFERHLDESRSKDDRKVDRRDDRHQRDRTESARDTKKANDQDASKKDTDDTSGDVAVPVAVVAQAPTPVTPDAKTAETDSATATTDDTSAIPALSAKAPTAPADKTDEAKASAEDGTTGVTPKVADAAPSKTEEKKSDDDKKAAAPELPAPLTAHPTSPAHSHQAAKVDIRSEVVPASAPVPAAQAALVAVAANAHVSDDTSKPSADATDPDAGLTIKGKEGLGHEAAAGMAEKSGAKTDAAQQQTPIAPTQNAQATTAPTNFAKLVAAATGGDATVTAGSSNDGGGTARLSDLQNVGGSTQNQTSNTATVRIGTLPGQTAPTQVPAMAIALQVARNLQKGVNRFDIRLDPAEMGRIDVRMEVKKDGNVSAHLTVDRPETLDLLQRDARALQQALNDAGLQANAGSLNFSLRDQNAGSNGQGFSASAPNIASTPSNAAAEEPLASSLYNINLSASGGVDIRV